MNKKKCAICESPVPMGKYSTPSKSGLFCETCKKYYCPKHFKVEGPQRIVAGVDTEALLFHCPKGHTTMW